MARRRTLGIRPDTHVRYVWRPDGGGDLSGRAVRSELPRLHLPSIALPTGAKASGVQWRKFGLLMYYYWHRNFGTAMSWFVWDFAFYGNKVRRTAFIELASTQEPERVRSSMNIQ
jgi:hypothetical protein